MIEPTDDLMMIARAATSSRATSLSEWSMLLPTRRTADQVDAWLKLKDYLIVSFCPICGGWISAFTTESENARMHMLNSFVHGDLIMPMRSPDGMGQCCPQADIRIDERTCDR